MKPSEEDNKWGSRGIMAVVGAVLILILGFIGIDPSRMFGDGGLVTTLEPTTAPIAGVDDSSFDADPVDDGTLIDSTVEERVAVEIPEIDTSGYGWYEIFFTDPYCPPEEERVGGVDEIVAADILSAEFQVDIAAFDLDSQPIINALIDAESRGIIVRFVTDDEHNPAATTNRLRRNGISVVEDNRGALMHNKFVIIDQQVTWLGSMNFTTNGVFCNNNNLVRIDSSDLAINYSLEMDEMYEDRQFGPRSPKNTINNLTINGVKVENRFAPEDEVVPIVAREVARADSEILFMAFSFTNEDVGEAVLERAESGLDVRGVFETVGSDTTFSYYPDYRRAKLDNLQVRTDGNGRIMHHKVIIIDQSVVVLGSFNFTNNANDNNDENLIIVHDPEFASFFVEEFEFVWEEAKAE